MTTTRADEIREIEEIAEKVRAAEEAVRFFRTTRSLILDKVKQQAIDEKISAAEITLNQCRTKIAKLTEKLKIGS
jgi:hypothetical protein